MLESDVLSVHRDGKIKIVPNVELRTIDDLRMIYTPGVAIVCEEIKKSFSLARKYTATGNTVCIATNGSAVLGLGDIGVLAAMPVMEGKSVILSKMANVNCMPILLDQTNADKIVDALCTIAKTFALIMIEDIKAPLCFEVERKLQEKVSIPVFHDDQHGTATVILAALLKALQLSTKEKSAVKIVINGAGAAGIATAKMLLEYGFKNIVVCDRSGAIYQARAENMNVEKKAIAEQTNQADEKGELANIIKGKDIFIGLSSRDLVSEEMVHSMNKEPIILALANPVPEIWPERALKAGAAIALDGRTVNNCLVFPGLIRGTLDAMALEINYAMKFKAAETVASLAQTKEIVPDFMDLAVHRKVAAAVKEAAIASQ
ncbi:MAG: NAD-dependent malic enzyme [Candidatus Omnitrophota bacterium]|nr:MAG: NAD-dependent malic enzyme [Candidatus Omnitrophota bacterium]